MVLEALGFTAFEEMKEVTKGVHILLLEKQGLPL
jgi:hypothetical protein